MSSFTLGTHNLHDNAGTVTPFADALLFTEFPVTPGRRAVQVARLRVAGYAVIACKPQPDLVIALRRRLFAYRSSSYERFVDGVPKVTPNRGTFTVFAKHRASDVMQAFLCEHRINAAFPPYIRGERAFRHASWSLHTHGTLSIIRRLLGSGFPVHAGGDLNTPAHVDGYRLEQLHERGRSLDRLASSSQRISAAEYLGASGSDHPRLRATVHP